MRKAGILRTSAICLMLLVFVCFSMPLRVFAEETGKKKVRVGWHEPPHFYTDQYGRKTGYSYEYQRKIAAYTGWDYEYVEGTWTDLFEKLNKGEIDFLSDVSYLEERTKNILYTSIPMGTEVYYLFVSSSNKEITAKTLSSLNGKKVGVTEGSVQKDFFVEWARARGINAEIVEMNLNEEDALKEIGRKVDAVVTMDTYASFSGVVPVSKIGSSEFFFAVNKNRPDLRDELDDALNKIQDENALYNQQLHDKYLKNIETIRYLSDSEKDWLSKHGKIRVGYQDNYMAFCAKDPVNGELTGALRDFLDYSSSIFGDIRLEFQPVAYPTSAAAIDALKRGEVDCVFPANLTEYDAEQMNLVMTHPLMCTEMDAVVRAAEQKGFLRKSPVIVAVNEGNTNYDIFLAEHYPQWKRKYFKDTAECLDAISKGEADCIIISSYRYGNIAKQCEKLRLSTVYTGVEMDYNFVVAEGNTDLYSILSKVTAIVPDSVVHSALVYYSTEDVKTSLIDVVKDNLLFILAIAAVILLIITDLIFHTFRAERKVLEKDNEVKDLNKKAFVDSLTLVRNKGAYTEYLKKLQQRVDKDDGFELAVGIFDCNSLKMINDQFGHEKGDIYLTDSCRLICEVFVHSPVFRTGGDEFAVFLMNEDFKNREKLIRHFDERQRDINSIAFNKWKEIHVAHGMAVYDPDLDDSINDTVNRADKNMYENKRKAKEKERSAE